MRVLLADSNPALGAALKSAFAAAGAEADLAVGGEEAIARAGAAPYDVIVLAGDGAPAILERIRGRGVGARAVLLGTPMGPLGGAVSGFLAVIERPCEPASVVERVRVAAEMPLPTESQIGCGDIVLDLESRVATRGGAALNLTPRETALLEILMRRPGEIVTRASIAESVWASPFRSLANVIDVHVANLRRKLERGGRARAIQTLRGKGFVIVPTVSVARHRRRSHAGLRRHVAM